MDVSLTPLTGGNTTTAIVLLVVALAGGVFAGIAQKGRWGLLLGGLVLIVALGFVSLLSGGLALTGPRDVLAGQVLNLYAVVVPLGVAFLAGFLASRGRWAWRGVVIVLAVLVLWLFPYPVVAGATADALLV